MDISRRPPLSLLLLLVLAGSAAAVAVSSGIAFWLLLAAALASLLGLLGALVAGDERGGAKRYFDRGAAVVLSICVCIAAFEGLLWTLEIALEVDVPDEWVGAPTEDAERAVATRSLAESEPPGDLSVHLPAGLRTKMERMQQAITFPRAWEKNGLAKLPGRKRPYYWHRALHVFDENEMRREKPFPPGDPSRYRIMVVGDSLTYGAGIDRYWTYPEQLARALGRSFAVEVLNLGISGLNSADVLDVVRRFLPELKPDLVIYGVCLNDFLPSDGSELVRFAVPIPDDVEEFFTRRTRIARLVQQRYGALLIRLGLRTGFYSDVLGDFEARSARFRRDVGAMNSLLINNGLPPVLALVLEPYPRLEGSGRELAMEAERHMRDAGMTVVDSKSYFEQFDGRHFGISRWEGHPNEEANAIFAKLLVRAVRGLPATPTHSTR